MIDLPRGYISYSQIRLYQSCPKKYYYTYVRKIPVPFNDKVFLGVVFHAVAEHYFNEKINGKELSGEELLERFTGTFNRLQKGQTVVWSESQEESLKRGAALVRYFLLHIAPDIRPLMVEKELIADLPGIDVPIKGVIDLVEADFSITDFKTTTVKWSKSKLQGHYLQVIIYRYLFEKSFGNVISQLKFNIIYSKNPHRVKHQQIAIKPKDVDYDYSKMFEVIKYVVENIRQEVFLKNESYTCGYCEFKDLCRESPS